jgi:ATP-dependent DNA helicase RecG
VKSRYVSNLDDKEMAVIEYVRRKGRVRRSELEKILKLKESSVRKVLEKLQHKGFIMKDGRRRNTSSHTALRQRAYEKQLSSLSSIG